MLGFRYVQDIHSTSDKQGLTVALPLTRLYFMGAVSIVL